MTDIPHADRIARYIAPSKVKRDLGDGKPGVIDSEAFMPRSDWPVGKGLEEYLSTTWLDFFEGDLETKLIETTSRISVTRKGFDARRSRVGIVTASNVHSAAALRSKRLRVCVVDPSKDPCYSGIYGMDLEDAIIAQELARLALLYVPRTPPEAEPNEPASSQHQ